MPDNDVRINVTSTFSSEGSDKVQSDARELREEFEHLADSVDQADAALRERYATAVEEAARQTARASEVMAQMGPFSGPLFADVARQALQAGDLPTATRAIMQGYREEEPRAILERLQRELLEARRAAAGVDPSELEPEAPYSSRLADRLRRRVEDAIPTVEANLITGRVGQADRSLSLAEQYLEQLRQLEGNTAELRALGEILGKHRESLDDLREQQQRREVAGGGDGGDPTRPGNQEALLNEIRDILIGRGLGGAGSLGGLVGQLGRFLGPWGIGALAGTALVGGANLALGWLGETAREGRQEAISFLDLQRQFQSDDLYGQFVNVGDRQGAEGLFHTRSELAELFYSARDAGEFASRYGLMGVFRSAVAPEDADPNALGPYGSTWQEHQAFLNEQRAEGLFRDVRAGLELARYTGTSADMVAELMRNAGIAGVAPPGTGNVEALASILFQAVRDGTRDGISSAETFQAMERYFADLQARGVTGTAETAATYAVLLEALRLNSGRALGGQAGERALTGIVEGMTGIGQPGLEMVALQAVGVGGALPSGREIGLRLELAEEYDRLAAASPILAGRFLLEQARNFNPTVLRELAAGFGDVFGGRSDLEFIIGQQFGLSGEQILDLRASHGSIWEFFQRATPDEVRRMSHTALRDVTPAGVTGDLATAGYRQQLEAEELERIRSLNASFQELDVTAQQFRKTLHSFVTDWLWERRFRDDPYWGPRIREWQEEQERQEREALRDRRSQQELGVSAAELARFPDDDVALVLHAANVLKARESRGDYTAVNEDAYGPENPALGAYQILASNLGGPRGWDTKHLGYEVTREEFMANPMLQDQIARGQLMEYLGEMPEGLDLEERARRLAVAWYAGPGRENANLLRDTSLLSNEPVVYTYDDGTRKVYPSQREYNDRYWNEFVAMLDASRQDPSEADVEVLEPPGSTAPAYEPPEPPSTESSELPLQSGEGTWHIEAQGSRYDPSEREIERLTRHYVNHGIEEAIARGMARNYLIDNGPAVLEELEGYRRGGFTGDGAEDDVAGVVHRGEFVVRADETRRHRELLERLNAGADEAALLAALAASTPAQGDGQSATGVSSGVVRFEGEGLLRIEVDERVPEGARLERYLSEGVQRWSDEVRSRYNQGNRRG